MRKLVNSYHSFGRIIPFGLVKSEEQGELIAREGGERPRVTSEWVHRTIRRECVAATGRGATHLGGLRKRE